MVVGQEKTRRRTNSAHSALPATMSSLAAVRSSLSRHAGALALGRLGIVARGGPLQFARLKTKRGDDDARQSKPDASQSKAEARQSKPNSTADLIPRSQMKIGTEEGDAAYNDTEKKMQATIEHHRRELAALELRGSGRVTPVILDPVSVVLPDGKTSRLTEIATVGVREGTTLLVSVFDEAVRAHPSCRRVLAHSSDSTSSTSRRPSTAQRSPTSYPRRSTASRSKFPCRSEWSAREPHTQSQSCVDRPTVEARKSLAVQAAKMTEDIRVQLRKMRDTGEKKAGVRKGSKGQQEVSFVR